MLIRTLAPSRRFHLQAHVLSPLSNCKFEDTLIFHKKLPFSKSIAGTSLRNGIIHKMKVEDIEDIIQPSHLGINFKMINDVIVAPIEGAVLILDGNLKTIKRYITKSDDWARSFDGNEEYIAVGYGNGQVNFFDRSGGDEPTVRQKENKDLSKVPCRFTNTTFRMK